MSNTFRKPVDAEEIAEMGNRERDVSAHFMNRFMMVRPAVQRVNVHFTAPMLKDPDRD